MSANELERPLSALSISSSSKSTDLDWDHQSSSASASAPVTPSPRRRRVELPNVDGTPLARLGGMRRPLSDLLRMHHADKANGVESQHLTEEEESRLREALDNWVNSADDDLSFHARDDSDESSSPQQHRTRSSTVVGDEHEPSELVDTKNAPARSDAGNA